VGSARVAGIGGISYFVFRFSHGDELRRSV
jgi:hypothetical protein